MWRRTAKTLTRPRFADWRPQALSRPPRPACEAEARCGIGLIGLEGTDHLGFPPSSCPLHLANNLDAMVTEIRSSNDSSLQPPCCGGGLLPLGGCPRVTSHRPAGPTGALFIDTM